MFAERKIDSVILFFRMHLNLLDGVQISRYSDGTFSFSTHLGYAICGSGQIKEEGGKWILAHPSGHKRVEEEAQRVIEIMNEIDFDNRNSLIRSRR